ncbi:hypothetical protein DNTS_035398, partial [Danionella cerebrum]
MVLTVVALGVICADASAFACCRRYTKGPIPMSVIKGYSIQSNTRHCNIDAVIFHTYKGKNVCTDPSKAWVMEIIRKLRDKAEEINKRNTK